MAVGEDAASLLNSPAGSNVGTDDIYDAVAITMPFEEIVDNRAFSPFTDGTDPGSGENVSVMVPDYCLRTPAGDFFYEYTPSSDQTLNVKASGDDTEIYVYDLAESGTDRCVVSQDEDNLHDSVSPHWFEATFPDDVGTCDHECSENLNVALTAGTTYHIVIASNSAGRGVPEDDYEESDDARSLIFVSMEVGVDAAANAPTEVPVPSTPFAPVATAGDGQASVTWTKPADNGPEISGYTVTSSGGQTCEVNGSNSSFCSVDGLTNGTAYTFTVKATNALGTSAASAPSNSVTPAAPAPAAPATPVPTLPLFGLGILASLLGLFGLRKLNE